jgi:hypothetical protein
MTDAKRQTQSLGSTLVRFWQHMPLLIRALISGLLSAEIGIAIWLAAWTLIPAP